MHLEPHGSRELRYDLGASTPGGCERLISGELRAMLLKIESSLRGLNGSTEDSF